MNKAFKTFFNEDEVTEIDIIAQTNGFSGLVKWFDFTPEYPAEKLSPVILTGEQTHDLLSNFNPFVRMPFWSRFPGGNWVYDCYHDYEYLQNERRVQEVQNAKSVMILPTGWGIAISCNESEFEKFQEWASHEQRAGIVPELWHILV
jgi:hypothetical protein